jgi:hypothetical protein
MNCTVCKEPISETRLREIPNADKCIGCASQNDVPKTRRFDEQVGEDVVENYYTGPDTPEIEYQRERLSNLSFGIWPTDDMPLHRPHGSVLARGRAYHRPDEDVAVGVQGNTEDYADKDGAGEDDAMLRK